LNRVMYALGFEYPGYSKSATNAKVGAKRKGGGKVVKGAKRKTKIECC
jgi:hypothetical protein